MKAQDFKGMAVVSLEEGTELGRTEQPLFDIAKRQLGAIEVAGDSGTFFVAFDQIERIGSDAITVSSSQVTQTSSAVGSSGDLQGLGELRELRIIDEAGTFLGTIDELEVDPESGQITHLTAHEGGFIGMGGTATPIEAEAILKVGPDYLTVSTTKKTDQPEP